MIERTIQISTSKVRYYIAGDLKNQPMLFLAGWPGIYLEESGVLQELAKYFYVVNPEHPGLLRSDPLGHYTNIFEQYADCYREILKKEKLEDKKLVVMGQSFGGAVASHYAYKYPKHTKTLILTDSVIGAGNIALYVQFQFRLSSKFLRIAKLLPSFFQKQIAFSVFGVPSNVFNSETISKRLAMVDNYTKIVTSSWDKGEKIIVKDYRDFPILFVWGDRDGKEFNLYGSCNIDDARDASENLKNQGKNIKFITVSGGHSILYEKPEYVIGKIMEYLNNIPQKSQNLLI